MQSAGRLALFLLSVFVTRAQGQTRPDSLPARDSTRRAQPLSAVVITPGTFGLLSPIVGAAQSLGREALLSRPQLGEDLFRSLQRLPGLAASDFSAAFHVRGAEVNQLYVSLDGLELYEPFHMKDFDNALSVLDVQLVDGIDLTTSGFTSEFGNRLGSVLAIRSRAPRGDRLHGSFGASVSHLRGQLEGGFGDGRGAWSIAARRGYLDLALRLAGRSDSLSPNYADLFATATWDAGRWGHGAAHVLWADDLLRYRVKDGGIESRYGNANGWVTWDAEPLPHLQSRTLVSLSQMNWFRAGDAQIESGSVRSTVHDARRLLTGSVRQDWSWEANDRWLLKAGAEWRPAHARYDYAGLRVSRVVVADTIARPLRRIEVGRPVDGAQSGWYLAARARPLARVVAEVGVRSDRTSWSRDAGLSPRANLLVTLRPGTNLRLAAGRYAQPQQSFGLQVQDGVTQFAPQDLARHVVVGVEQRVAGIATWRLEGYERAVTRQSARYFNLRGDFHVFPELEPDRALLPATTARARGVEFSVQSLGQGPVSWAASYTYARITDRVGTADPAMPWDQPHTYYLDATWHPSRRPWRVSVALQAHSGWPESPVQFVVDTVKVGRSSTQVTVLRSYGPVSALGTRRMPWYHRLDARATREFVRGRHHVLAFVDLFNIFDNSNPSAYNYRTTTTGGYLTVSRVPVTQLGWLPSAGVAWEF